LAVALAESCFNPTGLLGAEIDLSACSHGPAGRSEAGQRPVATVLFNESQSRIVISCAHDVAGKVLSRLEAKNIPHSRLGQVTPKTLSIKLAGSELSWPIETLHDDWFHAIRRAVESDAEPVRSL
jgi:phosphoribosylformylglycinamidine synthase